MPDRPRYTFGDTPLAAERLALVARVFEAPSRAFLAEAATEPPAVALDLGCGPGATTRLVAEVTRAVHTVGIDASPAFVELAAEHTPTGITFVCHDLTQLPFPHAPADLIYCRLLLAHLPDVVTTVGALMSQVAPGGRLLVDEIEWIHTDHPVLAAYEEVVVDLLASRGAPMYAGPIVASQSGGPGWARRVNRVQVQPVATADAAAMFAMNLVTWRDDPHIREHHDAREIDRLAADLAALADASGPSEITWGLRQVAYERVMS